MSVYSTVKIFHYPEKIQSLPLGAPMAAPIHIRVKPTNKCNHHCHYCAYRNTAMQLGQNMNVTDEIDPEKMREICNDIVDMGVKAVTFSGGGEPLIYPHLLESLEILHEGNVALACITNGSLLKGEIADYISHHVTWVRISMDGWDNKSYTRYRNVPNGEYTKILNNINMMVKFGGICFVGVSYIVDSANWPYLYSVLQRLKNSGIRSVKVSACIVSNDAVQNNAYHAGHFEKTQELLAQAQENLADSHFEIVDAWHKTSELFQKKYTWCPMSQLLTVIAADLGVYPCQDKAYNLSARLGDLKSQRFQEFWLHTKDAFFRINPCQDCQHHCVANEKNLLLHNFLGIHEGHVGFV